MVICLLFHCLVVAEMVYMGFYELGYQTCRYRASVTPDEREGDTGGSYKNRHSDLFKEFKWSNFHFRVTTWQQQLHLKLLVNHNHQIL